MNLANWSVKKKLIISYIVIVLVPTIILGVISYLKAESAIFAKVQEELEKNVEQYRHSLTRELEYAKNDTNKGRELGKNIVANLASGLMPLLDKYTDSTDLEALKSELASLKVGKSGYIFVLDYDGNNVVSYKRQTDGTNLFNAQDAQGNYFVQEIIKKGKFLAHHQIDFHNYPWKTQGQEKLKDKIAALIHLPEHKWIVGVSAYFHDLVDDNLEDLAIERFKKTLKAEVIGQTGYMFVMDSKGNLIMHPDSEGKNMMQYSFIQEIAKNRNGFSRYRWQGQEKIVAYRYYQDKDWIIVASSYLSDFTGPILEIRNSTLAILIISLILASLLAWLLARSIVNPILHITQNLNSSSKQVASASQQLSSASQQLSQSSIEQASSLEEASSSLEEITGMVKNSADSSRDCTLLAGKVIASSDDAEISMKELELAMQNILESNQKIQDLVKVIGQIGEKTEVIDEIVFQTKLLSFNASVEAERAGEHGRGFAVVAQEVGNLAKMSGKAAVEIATIVKESIRDAEIITRENKQKVEAGSKLSLQVDQVLKKINADIAQAKDHMTMIHKAAQEQAHGLTQLNTAVAQLDKTTQENAGVAEETANSSEELNAQAETLKEMIQELGSIILGNMKTTQEMRDDKMDNQS